MHNHEFEPPSTTREDHFTEYEVYNIPNWDGYGADPITPDTVEAARSVWRLLSMDYPPADVAPGGDGTIGFEWRSGSSASRARLILVVGPGDIVEARRVSADGQSHRYSRTKVDTGARQLIRQLFA